MPQINRIRVNNVKYNFGTQFYDDFIMRFNCRNTIYDLANGGGKSLLMLLLMQNMIPNCTLDEKQPIEKLFRKGSDNTCIHSLVEWKLDNNAVKDGFRYMTTGFCARKARDAKDEENVTDGTDTLTQAQASSSDNTSVEYFNYCIFYRKFGENDIKNLPLAVNGERVTYNGLKAYLREAEKSDYNIKVYIFDRKGDYQSFISRYGIYESAWEIVRGINKTEGHVRTYFETNYRTSRKVVEDLLIEEIIQKSYNNRLSVDNDDSMMAKTLLDIKDKLIELSKKNSQINDYDNQIEALTYFKDYIATYKEFYSNKSNIEDKLANMLLSVINAEGRKEAELSEHNEKEQELYNELSDKKYKIAVANVLKEKKSLNELDKLVKEALSDRNKKENQIKTAREKLMLLEAANNYCDYINYEKELVKVNTAIDSRMIEDEDIASELNRLAAIYKQYYDKAEKELSAKTARAAIDEKNLRDELKKADEKHQEDKNNCAVIQGQESAVKQQIEKDEKELKRLADAYGILIVDDIISKIEELRVQHNGILKAEALLEESIKETTKSVYKTEEKINIAESNIAMLDERIDQLQSQIISRQENESKLKDLQRIYGIAGADRLKEGIFKEFLRMNDKYNEDSQKAVKLGKLIEAVSAGSYYIDNPSYNKFREYLKSVCGEAVTEGYKYLENASEQQRKDIVKRIPFIQYSFVIDSGFDKLKEAELGTETQDSAVYPVISAEALKDENININSDKVIFAFNDISYLTDDKRRDVKVRILREELDNLNDTITKLNSRKQTVLEDYVLSVNAGDTSAEKLDAPEELLKRKNDIKENIAAYRAELGRYNDKKSQDMAELENVRKSKKSVELNISRYEEIAVVNERVTAGYVTLKQLTEQLKSAEAQIIECADYLDKIREDYIKADEYKTNVDNQYSELVSIWENTVSHFYNESTASGNDEAGQINPNELIAKITGLKDILSNKNSDVSDKENLRKHLKASIDKCVEAIEYRGHTLEELKAMYEAGTISVSDRARLMGLNNELHEYQKEYDAGSRETEAKEALLNRLEGSIAHAKSQIEEKYGRYEEFECDNPEKFADDMSVAVAELEKNIEKYAQLIKHMSDELKEIQLIRKDLERITYNAGIDIENYAELSESDIEIKDFESVAKEYEQTAKEYSSILKLEYKKADEFNKYKTKLIDELKNYNGAELAVEVNVSVVLPVNAAKTEQLVKSIEDTNSFIELEKERVHKGIEDMERIKDNFENRCIQTCCNIKTELERLPKLSHIRMDNEDIAIIGLYIPYVREEMYKDRMSAYIDETIVAAESFKEQEERFRYIRSRLSWKRLFSVIVTDMNSVRINLYKRERIKDQSRYLRYEEAVGSTGQSQGIYIQFLIAIINYISNMNTVSDGQPLGKTIFIDNPFGAAKDIYIWEPIFKLLAVNHVQLIVPARGATPAITSRFDVNYILGQKMADKRQQTVVVDYYSNVKETELEYTRMDYEQASFDFI